MANREKRKRGQRLGKEKRERGQVGEGVRGAV